MMGHDGSAGRSAGVRYPTTELQLLTTCSAVRHASAWTVSVGFRAPLVPMTDAPRMPRLGTSWESP